MNVRPFLPADEALLREIHERAGYGDLFPANISEYLVAIDDLGNPFMAAGARLG